MRYPKSPWGLKVKMFSQQYGLTLKDIAERSGVKVSVLYQVQIGKTPGREIIPKVDAFIAAHESSNRPAPLLTTFGKEETT
jgi:transcriptional regulator with XRE-family HTH domain